MPEPYVSSASADTADQQLIHRSHAIAMHGMPKYKADFSHFDYVNPDASQGGRISLASRGTFDSFNAYIEQGNPVSTGSVETLTIASEDEPFTQYGLLAESMEWPADRSQITFKLNSEARWHDGRPVTAEDVTWTFNTLITKGQPFYRYYYADVSVVEQLDKQTVRFSFKQSMNRELPLIMGQLPVFPKHYWEGKDFGKPTLTPPLGSGPYKVSKFEPGRYVTLERVEDYWGNDLPVRRGMNNFSEQHIKFYRDDAAIRLALKAGESDLRVENQAKAWALDYDVQSVRKGWLKKKLFKTSNSQGMQAFVVNLRRSQFSNRKVREALDYAFDFEWANRNLFFSQYTRTESYWPNSEMAARDRPTGEEKSIIEHYSECLPAEVHGTPYKAPRTNGLGWSRDNIEVAAQLLTEAGYEMRDFKLVNKDTGQPLSFEILYSSPTFERIVLPYVSSLKKLGIDVQARIVDQSQYVTRLRSFDFDMIWAGWALSESPGNELRDFFSSEAANNPASRNYPGIANPLVDQLIELVISANDRTQLVERTRALDRVLLANRYVIPNWHLSASRIAYWDKFGLPEITPSRGPVINTWWVDESKVIRLEKAMRNNQPISENLENEGSKTVTDNPDTNSNELSSSGAENTGNPLAAGFNWISAILPILILALEFLLIIKLHRILKRSRRLNRHSDDDPVLVNTEAGTS